MWFDNINQAVTLWRARSPAHWVIIFHTVYGRPPRCLLRRNSPNPAFLFQIPPFFLPGRRFPFPFHSCKLSDDVMLTEFPLLQTILLTSALLLATTHSCSSQKKRKKKREEAADLSHLSFGEWKWTRRTPTSHRSAVLSAHSRLRRREREGGVWNISADKSSDVLKIKPLCFQSRAFVFDMNSIILFWPFSFGRGEFIFPLKVWQREREREKKKLFWDRKTLSAQTREDGKSNGVWKQFRCF